MLIVVVCTVITERVVEPCGAYRREDAGPRLRRMCRRGSQGRGGADALVGAAVAIALLTFPPGALLRNQQTGSDSRDLPLTSSLIVLITPAFWRSAPPWRREDNH